MKKNIVRVFPAIIVIILIFVAIYYFSFNKNSVVSNQSAAIGDVQVRPTIPVSAFIVAAYTKHKHDVLMSCKDTSKCTPDTIDASINDSETYTTPLPYPNNDTNIEKKANVKYSAAYATRYGIDGAVSSITYDGKRLRGTGTITTTGPKGRTRTIKLPQDGWPDITAGIVANYDTTITEVDNVIGSDSSATWQSPIDGKTVDGVWVSFSYSGDSRRLLIVKGDPGRKYNVVLSGIAREWHLNKASDMGPDFSPVYFINGPEIDFCPKIRIMGIKLNYDCKRSFTLAPGTYDVTPMVDMPRYLYTISVISIRDTDGSE